MQEVFPPYSEKPEFIFKPSWDIRQELHSLHGCSMFLGLELTILSQKVGMRLEQVFCHSPRDGRLKDRPLSYFNEILKGGIPHTWIHWIVFIFDACFS